MGAAPEGMNPGTLGALLDVAPSTLSFHLKELMHSGLVQQEREIYLGELRIQRDRLPELEEDEV